MSLTKEQTAFRELIIKNMRRLADRAGVYTGRMCDRDRTQVLDDALAFAWKGSEHFNPERMSLLSYFDACLRGAMDQRKVWPRRTVGGWQYDYTERLLKGIRPLAERGDE